MFDWKDEELESIIWGEAGVSDDHIVPFPKGNDGKPQLVSGDQNRKECQQECTQSKPGQNTSEVKIGSHSSQRGTTSIFSSNDRHSTSGFGMVSWPDLSSSNVAKTDQEMRIESNNLKEVTKPDSLRASLGSHADILQNRHEDKEDGDFVDYGWDNIESFDDIDRFFSHDDPIFGNVSLDNASELWTPSKEIGNNLPSSVESPSLALGVSNTALKHIEVKAEYGQYEYVPFMAGDSKRSDLKSHELQNQHGLMDGHATAKSKQVLRNQETLDAVDEANTTTSLITADNATTLNKLADKVNKRKKILKHRKNTEERGKMLQDPYSAWSQPGSQFQRSDILPSRPSSFLPQKRPLHGPKSFQYQHISSPHVTPATYGNPVNHYPATPLLSNLHSEVSHSNKNHMDNADACMKRLTMTPQEKIEKLRRRQQMQALLAIQKQQQHINNIVPSANPSFKENQNQLSEGADVKVEECLTDLPSLDPNLPNERDVSNTVSITTDNNSLEGTILSQLQNVVSKLDIKERLCIRDSLFRLAQSSMHRHYTSDSSKPEKTIREEYQFAAKERVKTHNGYPTTMCDMETDTNHTDRTIARLLFHGQTEMEIKQHGTPESPISTMGSLFSSSENMGSFVGTKYPGPVTEPQGGGDRYISSPYMDTSHNASNHDLVDGRSYGEASK